MDDRHKQSLRRNRVALVERLKPSDLYDALLEKRVFSQDMIDEIKVRLCVVLRAHRCFPFAATLRQHLLRLQCSGTRRDQARQLVVDLETRGSRAFPLFLESLRETGQQDLEELLQNGAPAVHIQPATPDQMVRPVLQPLPICKSVIIYLWEITLTFPFNTL